MIQSYFSAKLQTNFYFIKSAYIYFQKRKPILETSLFINANSIQVHHGVFITTTYLKRTLNATIL